MLRRAAVLLVVATSCGGQAPIASTTTSHGKPTYAPPPPEHARTASGVAPLPAATDRAERLVFARAGSLWLTDPKGAEPMRLTMRAGEPDEMPAFSPTGDRVAFSSSRDGTSKIYVAPLDGSGVEPVTDGADGGDVHPAWAPDGKRIAFMRGRPTEGRDLYEVTVGGGAPPRRILAGNDDDPAHVGWPTWSPDGRLIALSADRREGAGTGLWAVAPDGKGLRRITRPARVVRWVRDLRASFSPDGARLVFASNRHGSSEADVDDLDIYDVSLTDGTITRLTRDVAIADDPCYSPDGRRIYFTSTRDRPRDFAIELFQMPAGGGEQVRLTRDAIPQNSAPSAGRIR